MTKPSEWPRQIRPHRRIWAGLLYRAERSLWCNCCQEYKHITEFLIDRRNSLNARCRDCVGRLPDGWRYITQDDLVPPDDVDDSDEIPRGNLQPDFEPPPIPKDAKITDRYLCVPYRCKQTYEACFERQSPFIRKMSGRDLWCELTCPQGRAIKKRFPKGLNLVVLNRNKRLEASHGRSVAKGN